MNIDSFIEAFKTNAGSEQAQCDCGELMDGTYMYFEGVGYVVECDCWHKRAKQVMGFIDGHASQIADYLNAERKRKLAEAESMPVIKTGEAALSTG
jgi:hypothetical protein